MGHKTKIPLTSGTANGSKKCVNKESVTSMSSKDGISASSRNEEDVAELLSLRRAVYTLAHVSHQQRIVWPLSQLLLQP